jgi:hypothetical protein
MAAPLLSTAANGHNWLIFDAHDSPQWHTAVSWLKRECFVESGTSITAPDERIFPSFVRRSVAIAAGCDNWSGNYLLAQCGEGDQVLLALAGQVAAQDRRSVA